MAPMYTEVRILSLCSMLIASTLSTTLMIPPQPASCPTSCSCRSATITCNNTVPDDAPDGITEVVLNGITDGTLTPRRFCAVAWPNVRTMLLSFGHSFTMLRDHAFDCLGQIQTLELKNLWNSKIPTAEVFHGFTNVTTLDTSQNYLFDFTYTNLFSDRLNFPKLRNLNLSFNPYPLQVYQDFIDTLTYRPLENLDLSKESQEITFNIQNASLLCQTLKTIILHDSVMVVKQLPIECDSLQYVDLSGNQYITQTLKHCVNNFVSLRFDEFLLATVMRLDHVMNDERGYGSSNCGVLMVGNTTRVRDLYFSHNYIANFEFLFYLQYLAFIDLSHNHIKTINPNAFGHLPALVTIDLSYNNLSEMPELDATFKRLFRTNKNLTFVDLSSNGLTYLPGESFMSNANLKEIHLSHNSFTQLSLSVVDLQWMDLLDLRFNNIRYLDSQSRQKVEVMFNNRTRGLLLEQDYKQLQILLEGNPFSCKCEALPFLQWFVASPIFNASYTCDLDDRKIPMTEQAVDEALDDCERPMRRRRTIALCTVLPAVAITTIVTMLIILKRRRKRRLEQQRFEDTIKLIRDEDTGFPYTVFLSYSSLEREFVVPHVRQPMEQHLQTLTGVHKDHVADDNTLIPGHPILPEIERLIAESAVFIAVVSANFCQSFYCNAEVSQAKDTGKPIILIFKEHVDETTMGMALRAIFLTNVRARIEQEGDGYKIVPHWDRLCKAIIGLIDRKTELP